MKMTVSRRVTEEVDVHSIRIVVPVRYGEEDIPNNFPNRNDDMWEVLINVNTGEIHGWPTSGEFASFDVHMKVCDSGCYYLFDAGGKQIAKIENDYVPSCVPGEYGDYVVMSIKNGVVADWKFSAHEIADSFFGDDD